MPEKKETKTNAENKRSVWKEFREFIMRGNVVEIAIGLTVGTAFTVLINSLIKDIVMPPIGALLRNVDFSDLYFNLSSESYPTLDAAETAGAPVIKYGLFLTNLLNFIILAVVIFFLIKLVNRLKRNK